MKLIPLKATKESINVKKGGALIYDTDQTIDSVGIILSNDPEGEMGLAIVNQVHNGGTVKVVYRPTMQPARKFALGDIVGFLAVF